MNLLVTGVWRSAKTSIEELERLGHNVRFLENEDEPLPCPYDWVEGTVCNGLFLHHAIEKFTNLRYIQLTSAGYDRVPMEYIREHGIEIHNARGVYSVPMAEFAVCGVLTLYKQLRFFLENQKAHRWEKHRGLMELSGRNVCIVGCGSVGTECAKRFRAFDCSVVGVDIKPYENGSFSAMLPLEQLDSALAEADIVILTLPLTDETKYIINSGRLAHMKQDAVLVNISRGGVADTAALIHALKSGKLRGAVLDVFEEEPLPESSPMWAMENVIVTPHNSFVGDGNENRLGELIIENIRDRAI